MAGIKIELQDEEIRRALGAAEQALGDLTPLYQRLLEALHRIHRERFANPSVAAQGGTIGIPKHSSPEGAPWAALDPSYQRRKKKNSNAILVLNGYLRNTLRGQVRADGLEFGTDRPYGAIHHFGGLIDIAARSQKVYFRVGQDGVVGRRFVSRRKANFSQWAPRGAHQIRIPARPWLGTGPIGDAHIMGIVRNYLESALAP